MRLGKYQNYQNGTVSNQLTDGERGGGVDSNVSRGGTLFFIHTPPVMQKEWIDVMLCLIC
jgi:hypothetical protein